MRISDWCIHRASHGDLTLEACSPRTFGGASPFGYAVTQTTELLPFEERLAALRAGRPAPRVRRVGIRPTIEEATRLAGRWGRK